ncbi:MFS general substrate transporter [Trametopsis cervina]|nr:MFS general substrate transporter [Trametopsis cervina]
MPQETVSQSEVSPPNTSTSISRFSTSSKGDLTSPVDTFSQDPATESPPALTSASSARVNIRLASAFVIFFVFGWGDGVTGTLLPYFKDDFHLSFMTSSLCFVTSTIGFAVGTILVEHILGFMGWIRISPPSAHTWIPIIFRRRSSNIAYMHSKSQARFVVIFAGTLLHPVFFVIMGCGRNFASMLVAYAISAFSRSVLTGKLHCQNHYVASTPKKALGYMYGYWSIGSMCAPLVCQSVIATGIAWNHFYFGSLVLSGISSSFAFYAFRPRPAELEQDIASLLAENRMSSPTPTEKQGRESPATPATTISEENIGLPELQKSAPAPSKNLSRALKIPLVWALALFLNTYTGLEAATQGYIVTYLLGARNANPKTVGYVTSGFWGGETVSRFVWGYFNTRITSKQRKYIVLVCMYVLALVFQLTIWFVDSFVENAIATAFLGVVYGPIFVAALALVNDLLPADLHMMSMQIGASCASFGSALYPFITGTIMNYKGPKTLVYVIVSQATVLLLIWSLLPSKPRNHT